VVQWPRHGVPKVAKDIAAGNGHEHRNMATPAAAMPGIYWRNVALASERYAMLDDSTAVMPFAVAPDRATPRAADRRDGARGRSGCRGAVSQRTALWTRGIASSVFGECRWLQ